MKTTEQALAIYTETVKGLYLKLQDRVSVAYAMHFSLNGEETLHLQALHANIFNESYYPPGFWLHGIKYLTKAATGYVFWKGVEVEHFSFQDLEREKCAALKLAEKCLLLEEKKFVVNSRTALNTACLEAPADTSWTLALSYYYAFFDLGTGVAGIFFRGDGSGSKFTVEKVGGHFVVQTYVNGADAFQALVSRGGVCLPAQPSYLSLKGYLERLGMPAAALDSEILRLRA